MGNSVYRTRMWSGINMATLTLMRRQMAISLQRWQRKLKRQEYLLSQEPNKAGSRKKKSSMGSQKVNL